MYPSGLYGTITHELHQEVSPVDFHSQKKSNLVFSFAYCVEGCTSNYKRAIAWVVSFLFDVAINWSDKTQPVYVAHYTDPEVRTFYLATKMVQWPQHMIQNLVLQIYDTPTPIFEDI